MKAEYISWAGLLLAFVFLIVNFILVKRQSAKIRALENTVKSLLTVNEANKKQFAEIYSGAFGMGKKLQYLDGIIKKTQEEQLNLVAQAPENKLYSRATKMVELGASVEELMTECELPRAEAELLINLKKKS